MAVSVFEHPLPPVCPEGHPLTPGRFRVGWMTCACPPAIALLSRGLPAGHHWMACKRCDAAGGTWMHTDPPHEEPDGPER